MSNLTLLKTNIQKQPPAGTVSLLSWRYSLSAKHLLDVISSIIAEEYVVIAKRNPDVFTKLGGRK